MALQDRIVQIAYELKDRFTRQIGRITGGFVSVEKASNKSSSKIENNNRSVERSFINIRPSILKLGTAIASLYGSLRGVTAIFTATKTYQQLNASLKTVTGSAENASEALEFISNFAKTTPFELEEVTQAFIKLKALGLDPSEDALTAYGNTAAATGKSLDQFIEAVADASVGEFERLKEFGIKARQQGESVSFTFRGITTTVSKNAKSIEGYLRNLGKVQFSGAMEEQMKTLGGQLSNLKDSFFQFAVDIGKAGAGGAAGNVLKDVADTVGKARIFIKENLDEISQAFGFIVGGLKVLGNSIRGAFNVLTLTVSSLSLVIVKTLEFISRAFSKITFGGLAKKWEREAENFKRISRVLVEQIKADAEDIKDVAVDVSEIEFNVSDNSNVEEVLGTKQRIARDVAETFGKTASTVSEATGAIGESFASAGDEMQKYNEKLKQSREESSNSANAIKQIADDLAVNAKKPAEQLDATDVTRGLDQVNNALKGGDYESAQRRISGVVENIKKLNEAGFSETGQGKQFLQTQLERITLLQQKIDNLKNAALEGEKSRIEFDVNFNSQFDQKLVVESAKKAREMAQEYLNKNPLSATLNVTNRFYDQIDIETVKRGRRG